MKRRIVIRGPEVQDVDYRGFLLDAAHDFEIQGLSARNLRLEGAVEALVEGAPENVERFVEFAETNFPETAQVEGVDVEECGAEVPGLVEYAEKFSTFQIPKIVSTGRELVHNQEKMIDKQGSMLDNQRGMLDKQDETIETIREESEKTRKTGQEESSKTRETVREESGKTRSTLEEGFTQQRKAHVETRELSKEVFYAEVEELRNEIRDLRSTVDEYTERDRAGLKQLNENSLLPLHATALTRRGNCDLLPSQIKGLEGAFSPKKVKLRDPSTPRRLMRAEYGRDLSRLRRGKL